MAFGETRTTRTTTHSSRRASSPVDRYGSVERGTIVWTIVVFAWVVRLFVATHGYSGRNSPPTYGDYEAQRNWMSMTLNLPISEWYRFSEDYWRLDYPPGSAYQSLLSGLIVGLVDPESVGEPLVSRGVEGPRGKVGMRLSVFIADLLVYVPACVLYWWVYMQGEGKRGHHRQQNLSLFWLVCNPALLLIDHGHFQYNCISLGCTVLATACVLQTTRNVMMRPTTGSAGLTGFTGFTGIPGISGFSGITDITSLPRWYALVGASFFFCMALNHKQMTLYYAPAFFVYLLTRSLCEEGLIGKARFLGTLGATVIGTFVLLWAPFGLDGARHILARIFPVQRGLYEDYVANFWCVSSLVYKWRVKWDKGVLASLCLVATVGACLPSLCLGVLGVRRKRDVFVWMLAGVSLSFYLFSFQVHEKSILMPLVAVSMLGDNTVTARMQSVAMMTMYPLLKKDGLVVAYWAMQGLVGIVGGWDWPVHLVLGLVHGVGAFVHVEGKPFLEDAVMMSAGFVFYVWVWFWVVARMGAVVFKRDGGEDGGRHSSSLTNKTGKVD